MLINTWQLHNQQLQHQLQWIYNNIINGINTPTTTSTPTTRQQQRLTRQQLLRQCTTTTTNAICMWYHFTRLNGKAFQGMSPQQFGWLKHPRAWALNKWMTSIPGHKPSTVEWLTFQGMSPQPCMSMKRPTVYISIQPNNNSNDNENNNNNCA